MADILNVYKNCGNCKGTGVVVIDNLPRDAGPSEEITCPECEGTKEEYWGRIREEEP